MLAGLLFATSDASDRHDTLAATLPIGGVTLIEFQARLLAAAGVSQIVVVVSRLTPELLGAINRLSRRGVTVDTVRGPAEAIAKLHPLAHILWLADGLVTTSGVVEAMRDREGDTLLVAPDAEGLERIGPGVMWAGVASIDPQRIADVAKLPSDYDFASSLLRVVAQRGAAQLALPEAAGMVAGAGLVVAVGGLAALVAGWAAPGLGGVVVALALFALSDVLAWLRDERRLIAVVKWSSPAVVALATVLLGRQAGLDAGTMTAPLLAAGTVVAGALAERAAGGSGQRRLWWATPPAYPLILLPAVIAGQPLVGLAATTAYAVATLAHAIERLRARMAG